MYSQRWWQKNQNQKIKIMDHDEDWACKVGRVVVDVWEKVRPHPQPHEWTVLAAVVAEIVDAR